MRSIRGWIRNLADGLGPQEGTVEVHAKPTPGTAELNETTHRLGLLEQVHLTGGSGSIIKADTFGHFGWDMELSPGAINVQVIPSDPKPDQYRWRFPDESAQVGKAFHSDLERLGWTGGRDGLVWGAIYGGNAPSAAQWNDNPTATWSFGDWGIATLGTGRVTIRPGIAFLGGVVFSVEAGDLQVPVTGDAAAAANGSGSIRWDILMMRIDNNPASATYGKQSFQIVEGSPGAGIAVNPGNSTTHRRLAIHALKMAPGASVYSAAFDLRRWLWHPDIPTPTVDIEHTAQGGGQVQTLPPGTGPVDSLLNTLLATSELLLPLGRGYDGIAMLEAIPYNLGLNATLAADLRTEGYDADGALVANTNLTIKNHTYGGVSRPGAFLGHGAIADAGAQAMVHMVQYPISRITPYHRDPVGGGGGQTRSWHRLRFVLTWRRYGIQNVSEESVNAAILHQRLVVRLWPVD